MYYIPLELANLELDDDKAMDGCSLRLSDQAEWAPLSVFFCYCIVAVAVPDGGLSDKLNEI